MSQPRMLHARIDLKPETKLVNDRFTIQGRIGSGGFSTVYRAYDAVRSEQVALKVVEMGPAFPTDTAQQLLRETILHTGITDYRHILRVHDIHFQAWMDAGLLVLSMEHAEGAGFRKWLIDHREDRDTRRREGTDYFIQACTGVAALHEAGIVHLDLKPENFLLCGSTLKVADLGASRTVQTLHLATGVSEEPPDLDIGTLPYMSPEQIAAAHPDDLDARSDIYSLGVILFEILHPKARPPFGGSARRIRDCHLQIPAPTLPDATPIEAGVVERCLAKNPADRYASVEELLDDLEGRTPMGTWQSPPDASRLTQDAADEAWQRAQEALAQGNLNEATRQCEVVLRYLPEHAEARQMREGLQDRYQQAERFYRTIESELDHRPVGELATLVQEAVAIYPQHPTGQLVQVRLAARAQEYRQRMEEGLHALRRSQWEAARACFQRAQQLNAAAPGLTQAIALIPEIQQQVVSIRAHIDEAIAQGDRRRALDYARRLDEYTERLTARFQET